MPATSLESCFILILFYYFNVIKSYRKIKINKLIYFSNLFLHLYNK